MIPLRPKSDETFGWVAVNFYAVISKAEFPAVSGCLLKKKEKKKGLGTDLKFILSPFSFVICANRFFLCLWYVCMYYAHKLRINSCIDPIHADG